MQHIAKYIAQVDNQTQKLYITYRKIFTNRAKPICDTGDVKCAHSAVFDTCNTRIQIGLHLNVVWAIKQFD
jgi:hypothetical protein